MAKLRNNLSLKMQGRAGAYTFYSSKGRQIARVSQNSTNYGESARRSLAQQERRVRWSNLVNFYKSTSGYLRGAFESKRANESDYNAFMRKNLPAATVALTKDVAATGRFAVQKFLVSEGSLPTLNFRWSADGDDLVFMLGLKAGSGLDLSEVTIAAFTQQLMASQSWIKEGMQITLVIASSSIYQGQLRSGVDFKELTLSLDDSRMVGDVYTEVNWFTNISGDVYIQGISEDAYVAVLMSETTSGKLKVSTAELIPGDTEVEETYSSEAAVAAAVQSYGLDPDRFLDSGDYNA